MAYAYVTLAQLRSDLLTRLQDSGAVFTPIAEANLYIQEALRTINALTYIWNDNYQFDFNPGATWETINVPGSPRERTVTDTDIYNQMEAMLLEPMTGGTWTGTNQYNINMLSGALQYRRDEILLQSAANPGNTLQNSPVLSTTASLPQDALDLKRVRWIAQDSSMPYVLGREDVNSANAFGPLLQIQPGAPESWMITANQPLEFSLSCPPNQPGTFDMIISFAGAEFAPPTDTLVNIPDDWTPTLMYGALADVLANSPEGRDSARAKYCVQRYLHGIRAMQKLPWLIQATVSGIPADTTSVKEMDTWLQDWETRTPVDSPVVVVGGVDLIALAPFNPPSGSLVSTVLTVVGNAPVPVLDTDSVQLSPDGVDAVLNYAQHTASFKMGGADFALTLPLYDQFEAYCRKKNEQYAALGIFRPSLLLEGNREEKENPRFEELNGAPTR